MYMLQFISWLSHRCSVMHMLQQHKCRVIVAFTLSAKLNFHRIWIPWGRYFQCLPSLTRSSLTRSSWQSGNRLVNALPGDVTIGFRSLVWAYFRLSASGDNRFWCFGCTRNNHGTLLRVRVQSPFSKREMSFLSLSKGEKGKMGQALSVRHVHEFRYCDKNTWAILGLRSDTSEKGDSRLISKWQKTFNLNDVSGSNQYMGKIFFRYKICAIKFWF